jgi:AmmeMemoRadiSam system protein B/AmmeMemoRadiSam system protein A
MEKIINIIKFVLLSVPFWAVPVFVFAEEVQKPVVAGYFYPDENAQLKQTVDNFIERATPQPIEGDIMAIISPHAGYQYSGWVAGYAFKAIKNESFKTAIIIAPSHHYNFQGLAVLDKDSYLTPLGKIPIDKDLTKKLISFDKRISYYMQPFLEEHAAEVEIPFLQRALPECKVVVILTGNPSYDTATLLRDALASILKDRKDVLLIASTDMSHYHTQEQACLMDKQTISIVERFEPEELFAKLSNKKSELCGGVSVTGVMMAARSLGADRIKILNYATSGDVTGDMRAVVGYFAAAIYKSKEKEMKGLLNQKQKKRLLEIARKTIETYVREGKTAEFTEDDEVLHKEMGAFVTLHKHGQLRGCIGNMVGRGPLYLTVRNMAIESATQDPRFAPVKENELKDIDIEISVLSPLEKIDSPDKIVMGRHGVLVQRGFRSGVYLPQVATETGWDKEEFMNSLCLHKAGIPATSWKDGSCDIYIFSAEVFGEKDKAE